MADETFHGKNKDYGLCNLHRRALNKRLKHKGFSETNPASASEVELALEEIKFGLLMSRFNGTDLDSEMCAEVAANLDRDFIDMAVQAATGSREFVSINADPLTLLRFKVQGIARRLRKEAETRAWDLRMWAIRKIAGSDAVQIARELYGED
jgi:hypothetical protein